MIKWRFVDTGFLNGYENMALDEALLLNFKEGDSPVLRFYGWEPAAVSLGRFQKVSGFLDTKKCVYERIPLVRTITGGGMIFHHGELTYSITASKEHLGIAGGPVDAYRKVCGFLLEFYRRLGLDADFAGESAGGREDFCFAANEQYDITVNGQKIGGNAQRWMKNCVFQHGSIPVDSVVAQARELLVSPSENLAENSTSLRELGITDSYRELFILLEQSFFAPLEESGLSQAEQDTMAELLETKYTPESWKEYENKA